MPTPMEEYLFDLHGYTVIKGALDPDHLRATNDFLDALPPLQIDQWYGNIDVHTYSGIDGVNLQNIIEGANSERFLNDSLIIRLGLIWSVTTSVPTIDHSSTRDSLTYASRADISVSIPVGICPTAAIAWAAVKASGVVAC